ncbi:DUF4185 domain-containing protein [Mucilaginibacter sp. OK283]|uniref:DUF4185 domain-containing protein n=1 Tax=Mucilaginibacter sp. OK283 TaxID=1881049 RepID=UPI0008C723D6|nr:DUF4185 domain-containing protein [Mucilaginibacter sp. OK283]SEO96345.1 protein of unknown function [Mucilaginibacter sp. OK283]
MRNFAVITLFFCIAASLQTIAQTDGKKVNLTDLNFTVEAAPEWSSLLKRETGWFGGDGIYTIPLNGVENKQAKASDKILFIFSDSMIGKIENGTMVPGFKMIHNSVAVLHGNQPADTEIKFAWDIDKAGAPESLFIPHTAQTAAGDYYWLGDGFVNQELNNAIYIFGYRVRNVGTGAFGFREVGNTLIKIPAGSQPPYKDLKQMDTPFYLTDAKGDIGSFGAGIYVNTTKAGAPKPDGYIYVYGVHGIGKNLMVARVLPKDFEKFDRWTFYDGTNWIKDMNKVADVTNSVSNELSLTALPDGRYALIFQVGGMSTNVGMRIGATPYGPFGPVIKIWDCKPDLEEKTFLVYNAKAHPSLSAPGELLISYNINSVDFIPDLMKKPNLYRPRFIRMKISSK